MDKSTVFKEVTSGFENAAAWVPFLTDWGLTEAVAGQNPHRSLRGFKNDSCMRLGLGTTSITGSGDGKKNCHSVDSHRRWGQATAFRVVTCLTWKSQGLATDLQHYLGEYQGL